MIDLNELGARAKAAASELALLRAPEKNAALNAMADEALCA